MLFRSLLIVFLLPFTVSAQYADTFILHYPIGQAALTLQDSSYIDSLIEKRVIHPGQQLSIIGYCDYLGGTERNKTLSYQRAENVMLYLISQNFSIRDIELCIGKGKINRKPAAGNEGYAEDRKVAIAKPGKPRPTPKPKPTGIAKLKVNETISLDQIFFMPGSHVLVKSSYKQLDSLYVSLNANPNIRIRIEGHICCALETKDVHKISPEDGPDYLAVFDSPDADAPGNLSENRAQAVMDFLSKKGIDPKRMSYKGLGQTMESASKEQTMHDKILNRRVDIRITGK